MALRTLRASKLAVLAFIAVIGLVLSAATAGATPPEPSGFDDLPDLVVGGGSDTTYLLSGDLVLQYNRSPGCPINTGTTSVDKAKCLPGGAASGPTANWDRDALVEATPTGSSSGVNALLSAGVQYNPPIDYARSSRGPSGSELNELTFWGYAHDGLAVYTLGGRQIGNLSGIDIYNIYNCTLTDFSQIAGYTGPAGPIFPYGINPSAGTFASFRDYLRSVSGNASFDPNAQPCVRKVGGADGVVGTADDVYAFENDLKLQANDPGPDNVQNTADDVDSSKLTWSSYSITRFPFLLNTGAPWAVNGVQPEPGTIFAKTYPINRTVNHVTRNVDADCRQTPGSAGTCDNSGFEVYGADSGKPGAVREYTEWLCRQNNTQHAVDSISGKGYKTVINDTITKNGFTQVPTGDRTTGYSCKVLT